VTAPRLDPGAVIVVRGDCTPEELAALVVALKAALSRPPTDAATGLRAVPPRRYRAPRSWAAQARHWPPAA